MKRIFSILTGVVALIAVAANNYIDKSDVTEQNNNSYSVKSYSKRNNKNKSESKFKTNGSQPSNYRGSLRVLWSKVYPEKGQTFYCGYDFDNSKKSAKQNNINAEHIFPMSWATKDLSCGTRKQCHKNSNDFRIVESDLHNIYPANTSINRARSNYRFTNISGEKREFGKCDFEVNPKHRTAEPADNIKGEIARSMLYMEYKYGLTLREKTKKQVLNWDKIDAPNTEEKRRNKIIKAEQGRDNPFISRYPFSPRNSN